MGKSTLLSGFLGLVVLATIILAFVTFGGPGQARLDREDAQRARDLYELSEHVLCHARGHMGALPDTLASITGCQADPPLTDPVTGSAYRYAVNADGSFEICADFHDAGRRDEWSDGFTAERIDATTGCLIARYTR